MNAATSSQMLLAFWRQRDRQAPWGRRLLLAVALLAVAINLCLMPQLWPAVLCGSAALALATLWMAVAGSLLVQNHPHAARLVPGHVRQLREAALATWAATTGACALLLWLGVPAMPSLPALWLLAALVLVFTAWAMRRWQLWLVVSVGPGLFFGLGLNHRLAGAGRAWLDLWNAQPLSLLALSLLALGWALWRLLGDGDAAHREAYACHERLRLASQAGPGSTRGADVFGRPGEQFARPFQRATAAWLGHLLAQARPAHASVMHRAEVVLHGPQHWLRQVLSTLVALGLAAAGFAIGFSAFGTGLAQNWKQGAYGMAIGLASIGFNPCFALPGMLWHSRREQALLRLLPGMPQGQALNRAVAWLQLRHALLAWALTTAALAGLASAAGDPALLCLAFAALPLCALCLLRVPARLAGPSAWATALPVLAFMAAGWGLYVLHRRLDVPLPLLAAACVATATALGTWRWRALSQAPVALPAGRLA